MIVSPDPLHADNILGKLVISVEELVEFFLGELVHPAFRILDQWYNCYYSKPS